MSIDINILISCGATTKQFKKGEYIFTEGTDARFFFQIMEGEVKLTVSNEDGKEFIQGIFKKGESFGEPPLLIDKLYPSTAIALSEVMIIRLAKEKFFVLLNDYPQFAQQLLRTFAQRIYDKSLKNGILTKSHPEERILAFFDALKAETKTTQQILIPHTRQQIADSTGLRVETVIRTLRKMHEEKIVYIRNHKVYY